MSIRKWALGLAAAAFAASTLLVVKPVWSVHDTNLFELDGNVVDGAANGTDWSAVNGNGSGPPVPLNPVPLARTFIPDPGGLTVFAGGGSKDDLDLNGPLSSAGGWKHKTDANVPDKDNITNAYAVAYNFNNDLVIYAGADRFDTSGDAHMGFWFFQNQVGLGSGGGGGGSPFIGQHAFGDILVLANFSNGGTTVAIEVLRWVGSGGNVNGTLQRIAGAVGGTVATCNGGLPANDRFCGITNPAQLPAPGWPYTNKDGAGTLAVATFFEVGINISAVLRDIGVTNTPCFSAFMAETRASTSVDATLKDFALGSFPVCSIAVTKTCEANPVLVNNNTQLQYTISGQFQNTGFGAVTNVQLSDNPAAVAGSFRFGTCGTDPATWSATPPASVGALTNICYQARINLSTNGGNDTVTATASTGAATLTANASAICPPRQFSPQLSVAKSCSTILDTTNVAGKIVVRVNVAGSVCNISQDGTTINSIAVQDNVIATPLISGLTLAPGACADFNGTYLPGGAENRSNPGTSTVIPGLALFKDTVTASGTAPFSTVVPQTAPASCTLCPTCSPDVCTPTSCPQSTGAAVSNALRITR